VIVNTTINDANGHGIIVAAHDSLIESNTISNVGRAAISFAPYMLWLEGAFPKNVTVANNLIEDSMRMKIRTGERKCGGIVVSCLPRYFVTNTAQEAVSRILTNIEVVSNTVRRCGYTPIVIKNAYNPVVTDNVIDTPMHSPTGMLATLNFSSGGFDQGFNCGIYYNNTTGCSTGGNSFVNLNGYAAQYIGPDNTGLH
jgi:hypothetical protein